MTTAAATSLLMDRIRDIPDFPKEGIVFKDITPLLKDPEALKLAVDLLVDRFRDAQVATVVGIESRGFILGAPVAYRLGAGFVPVRKPGKLPYRTAREDYALEYGTDALEIHEDAIAAGDRILIIDDLLATGGTVAAAANLVQRLGGNVVGAAFLVELAFLGGRDRLPDLELTSLVTY